jgi:DNA helicase HerA-like ATPase
MGPLLLTRILNLNDVQSGVLNIAFKIADDSGLLLLDLKDLRAMIQFVGDNAEQFKTQYGNISAASIGAIQRNLLAPEQQAEVFREPASTSRTSCTRCRRQGVINIITADKLMQSPRLMPLFL